MMQPENISSNSDFNFSGNPSGYAGIFFGQQHQAVWEQQD